MSSKLPANLQLLSDIEVGDYVVRAAEAIAFLRSELSLFTHICFHLWHFVAKHSLFLILQSAHIDFILAIDLINNF